MTKPKRKVGGQPGNTNAMKHGGYCRRFLPDSPQGRLVRWIETTLTTAIPNPSPQETLILKRASMKAFRCDSLEREILRCNGSNSQHLERLEQNYLKWSRELRADLQALGFSRRSRPVQDLGSYLAETYGSDEEMEK